MFASPPLDSPNRATSSQCRPHFSPKRGEASRRSTSLSYASGDGSLTKALKKLKEDGAHVKKGEAYCEIEVMKMFMPLKVDESGVISWCSNEGAAIAPGNQQAGAILVRGYIGDTLCCRDGECPVVCR